MDEQKPSYWAVVPSVVRYDNSLPPNAKLLYAEISALTDERGYCYAQNAYFCRVYGWSQKTVSRLLIDLKDRGYIRVEVVRNRRTNGVEERRIYAGLNPALNLPPKNVGESPQKMSGRVPDNFEIANKEEQNSIINTPLTPQEKERGKIKMDDDARALLSTYVGEDRELSEALDALMEVRTEKKAVNSGRAINALLNKLNKLSAGNRDMKLQLIQESLINGWKSVFPLKGGDRLSSPPARREVIPID